MASDDSEAFELARHGRPAGMLRGRRAVGIAAAALATVLAVAVAGVAVRDRTDRDQVAVDPWAGPASSRARTASAR